MISKKTWQSEQILDLFLMPQDTAIQLAESLNGDDKDDRQYIVELTDTEGMAVVHWAEDGKRGGRVFAP